MTICGLGLRSVSLAAGAVALAAAGAAAWAAAGAADAKPVVRKPFRLTTFATAPNTATTAPDDIAWLGRHVFVAWQNGVGAKGEPAPGTGQTKSLVVEYSTNGNLLKKWSLKGRVDGLGGDPRRHLVIATVNDGGRSSLFTIKPAAKNGQQVRHYAYSPRPDAKSTGGVYTGGGSDSVTVRNRTIYVSASAPATTSATAMFIVRLDARMHLAELSSTFADNATATNGLTGQKERLDLGDPDSNATVPAASPRYGGEVMLESEPDQELVFCKLCGAGDPSLSVVPVSREGTAAGVDDVRWAASSNGTLYIVDGGANKVYRVTGPFAAGEAYASLNRINGELVTTEVDRVDLGTGALTPWVTGLSNARGLLWTP